ncbi:MAG: type IX secretion system membrane protein PorP/SprF [Bacteroidia bacterium]|nr:type IX secretion system membrane protein PorP/SprF [Bacteroidia bacterium]
MNRLLVAFFVFLIFATAGFAQQDPQFSFNMFNQLTYNPGFAGSNDAICASTIHRQQWVGFEGRPVTTMLNAHAAVEPFKIKSGVGLIIEQEKLGFQKNFNLSAVYAYRTPLGSNGYLGIGLGLGLQNTAFNGNWVTPDGGNPYNDPNVPRMESHVAFDMNFGAFYKGTNGMYVGLSTTHLTEPKIKLNTGNSPFIKRHYYMIGSYPITLGNPMYIINPIVYIKSDGITTQFTVNSTFEYNRRLWAGVSYNIQDAITAMVGINFNFGLSVGYAYDFGLSDIGSYNSGSHEIYARYCFNLNLSKTPGRYKSVRFL